MNHRNGMYASMLFINEVEYTGNLSFAKEFTYPLLDGFSAFWSCFLNGTTGDGLLHDIAHACDVFVVERSRLAAARDVGCVGLGAHDPGADGGVAHQHADVAREGLGLHVRHVCARTILDVSATAFLRAKGKKSRLLHSGKVSHCQKFSSELIAGAGMSSIASQRSVMKPRSGFGHGARPTAQLPMITVVTPLSALGVTIGSHMTCAS